MQCKQLLRLIKEWHNHVSRDTMAPARMMQFIDNHVKQCDCCTDDKGLAQEIEVIRERIMPKEDLVKISRSAGDLFTPDIFEESDTSSEDEAEEDPA
jgi:hypothetical protein